MIEVVKCPKCNGEMDKGFIGAWYIFWSDKQHWVFWRNPSKKDLLVGSGWTAKNLDAFRCKECELVLFNYGYVPSPPSETPEGFLKKCVQCGKEIPIASEECVNCGVKQPEEGVKS